MTFNFPFDALKEYLQRHRSISQPHISEKKHYQLLEITCSSIYLLCPEESKLEIFREIELISDSNKILLGKLDLVALSDKDLYLFEVKTPRGYFIKKHRLNDGWRQLAIAHDYFLERYGVSGKRRLVYTSGGKRASKNRESKKEILF